MTKIDTRDMLTALLGEVEVVAAEIDSVGA